MSWQERVVIDTLTRIPSPYCLDVLAWIVALTDEGAFLTDARAFALLDDQSIEVSTNVVEVKSGSRVFFPILGVEWHDFFLTEDCLEMRWSKMWLLL